MAKGENYAMFDNAIAGAAQAFDVDPSVLKELLTLNLVSTLTLLAEKSNRLKVLSD